MSVYMHFYIIVVIFKAPPLWNYSPNHFNSKEYVISVIPTPSHRLSYLSCESAYQLLVFLLNVVKFHKRDKYLFIIA